MEHHIEVQQFIANQILQILLTTNQRQPKLVTSRIPQLSVKDKILFQLVSFHILKLNQWLANNSSNTNKLVMVKLSQQKMIQSLTNQSVLKKPFPLLKIPLLR